MTAPPPHDLATERSVLGAPLVHPRVMLEIGMLREEHFYDPRHGSIFAAMRALDMDQAPIDALSVGAHLEKAGKLRALEMLGGLDYLTQLMSEVVTVENVGYHAKRLMLLARRRQWLTFGLTVAAKARDLGIEHEDMISDAERDALNLSIHVDAGQGPQRFAAVLRDFSRVLEKRWDTRDNGKPLAGLATRLSAVDEITQGFAPEDLVIIAARPSMGKTAAALNCLIESATHGDPALMFSLEMSNRALVERAVARESGVAGKQLRRALLNQYDWQMITRSMSRMSDLPIWLEERPLNIHEMRTTARQWKAANKVKDETGVVVVDYLQRVPVADKRANNREREVAELSDGLKSMARELKLPVIALAQLGRQVEQRADKRPMLSDLRESGAIEQDADTVIFLYRDDYYNKDSPKAGRAEFIVAKQRNGDTGTAEVGWDKDHQRFYDVRG